MFIYIVKALSSEDPISVSRKWRKKHRHHPLIREAIGSGLRGKVEICERATWNAFQAAIRDFVPWHEHMTQNHPGEVAVLWLSIHGALTKTGVKFDSGFEQTMHQVLGPISRKLLPNVVLLQSICWGG